MHLEAVCEIFRSDRFPRAPDQVHPESKSVADARIAVGYAVVDDEFLVDCIALEVQRLSNCRLHWGLDPFFTVPETGVRLAFGYWPPGGTAGAHEHTAWTITAVCRNYLEVLTYDWDQSCLQRRLVPKNRFEAPAGKTGFIYSPCIHEPRNTSGHWSLSFHATSPLDGQRPSEYQDILSFLDGNFEDAAPLLDHPYGAVVAVRRRQQSANVLAQTLTAIGTPKARATLMECALLTSPRVRRKLEGAIKGGMPYLNRSRVLVRTHHELVLASYSDSDTVALIAESPTGQVDEIVTGQLAKSAIAFAAQHEVFEVQRLPGNLTAEEREAIGDALEETGLFQRMAP